MASEKNPSACRDNKPTAGMELAMRDLEHDKPDRKNPASAIHRCNFWKRSPLKLAKQWPSGAGIQPRPGLFWFAWHEQIRSCGIFSLLNQLWDGTSLTVDRRSTESSAVPLLTMALQVQEPTLHEFSSEPARWHVAPAFLPASLSRALNNPRATAHRRRSGELAAPC